MAALSGSFPPQLIIKSLRVEKPFPEGSAFLLQKNCSASVRITEQPHPSVASSILHKVALQIQSLPVSFSFPCFSYRPLPLPLLPEVVRSLPTFQPVAKDELLREGSSDSQDLLGSPW